jgi:hypothetical protein
VSKFGKSYGTKTEYQFRLAEFSRNLQAIEENNSDPESTHEMGVNKFSDWTKDEMKRILGYRPAPG